MKRWAFLTSAGHNHVSVKSLDSSADAKNFLEKLNFTAFEISCAAYLLEYWFPEMVLGNSRTASTSLKSRKIRVCGYFVEGNNDIGIHRHIWSRAPGKYQYIWLISTGLYLFLSASLSWILKISWYSHPYAGIICLPKKMTTIIVFLFCGMLRNVAHFFCLLTCLIDHTRNKSSLIMTYLEYVGRRGKREDGEKSAHCSDRGWWSSCSS